MTKRKKIGIIFIVIGLILAVSAGLFYWYINREIKGSPDDYVIRKTSEGTIVENERAGLIVKAPEGWEVKKIESFKEGSVVIQSPNMEGEGKNGIIRPPLTSGCGIEVTVTHKKMNFEEIKTEMKEIHWILAPKFEEFEEVIINNQRALKNTLDSKSSGPMIGVYIPKENKVYNFTLIWASNEKEKCIQEFDIFLNSLQITN